MKIVSHIFDKTANLVWVVALVGLPITSFSLFTKLSGAIVTPFSAMPILLLFLVVFLYYIRAGATIPIEIRFLILFLIVISISSLTAFFLGIFPTPDRSILQQMLRAYISLAIGVTFYIVFSYWPFNKFTLNKTLFWISIGGIISLIWSAIQAYYLIYLGQRLPPIIEKIQLLLVFQAPFFYTRGQRIAGLTYEASWYAHEMVILYIPIWLGATLTRTSSFKFQIGRITVESVCLVIGIFMFYLSSPRISLVSIVMVISFLATSFFFKIADRFVNRFFFKVLNFSQHKSIVKFGLIILVGFLGIFTFSGLIFGVLYLASQRDWRLALLFRNTFNIDTIKQILLFNQDTLLTLGHRLAFLERTVYWLTGWRIFNEYPFLGVGLGNAGFFFPKFMPPQGWASYEVRTLLASGKFLNIKSYWFRLLAESGIIGLSFYLTWLYVLWKSASSLSKMGQNQLKWIGTVGQIAIIAWVVEGLSIDSFAMPYFWIVAGLVSGVRHQISRSPT